MITKISLGNFKCYDTLSLALGPLTLLTGFNAGGKSTALQGLLLLSQAVRTNSRSRWISLNGPLVQLGTPGEIINKASDNRHIALGAQSVTAGISWRLDSEERIETDALPISQIEFSNFTWSRSKEGYDEGLDDLLPTNAKSAPELREIIDSIRTLIFLSATRDGPREIFSSPQTSNPIHADVGSRGEFATWWLEKHSDDDVAAVRRLPSEPGTTLRRQVSAWGGELFPGFEAAAQSLQKTGLVQLQLRTRITDDWRRPSNVGYGLSYAFPILVAGLLARRGQILFIDSPEAHLHPKAQSKIGRFLAAMANAGVRVVVETHSDHVLNGIRLAVHDKTINAEDVIVHFFSGVTDKSHGIISLQLDASGAIDSWPSGFFDQSEHDLTLLAGWE